MPINYSDEDLNARWEEFYESSENRLKVMEVADRYPEFRSVVVSYNDIDMFDPDMASQMLEDPDRVLSIGEKAIKKIVQQGKSGEIKIHFRVKDLPKQSKIEIRNLRSEHLGKLIAIEGLVRKATEVRPKMIEAHFKCFRCPAVIVEPQDGLFFREPLECYKEQNGCGRTAGSTKFLLLAEESKYVDTQKIELQENPEGLRGGAQPERLTAFLEDDLSGKIFPGDRISLNGVLRSVQKGDKLKSTLFDIHLDVLSIESKEQEYEEVEITDEDEKRIVEEAHSEDIFDKIVKSISPTIKGYDEVKESIALQLFGGTSKQLDDGTKVRGDIHILLVGDPGVAKCVTGDAMVWLADGSARAIKEIVEEGLAKGEKPVDDGVYAEIDLGVLSFSWMGAVEPAKAIKVWKRTAPAKLLKFTTKTGKTITVTPTHPLFVQNGMWMAARHASKIMKGQEIAVSTGAGKWGKDETLGKQRGLDWEAVESIEEVLPPEPYVYDLEVDKTHIFIANGIMNHNSQMLRYMSQLAPRGIYASGKSSSAAGLCVSPDAKIEIDGEEVKIGQFVDERMSEPVEFEKGEWKQDVYVNGVKTLTDDGMTKTNPVVSVFRLTTPSFLVEIISSSNRKLRLTAETKLFTRSNGKEAWSRSSDVMEDDEVLTCDKGSEPVWEKVTKKRLVNRGLPKNVYDLTVKDAHSFFANGFLVHNTAAAVKDEFGEGRWTLEAGALVLADKGLACISGDQHIITSQGLRMLREVKPGDFVLSYDNGPKFNRVKYVLDKGAKPTMKIHLHSGEYIECTDDHLILTNDGWKEAGQIQICDSIKRPADYSIPIVNDQSRFEKGFLHGFAVCDIYYGGAGDYELGFSSAIKNIDRAEYVVGLIEKYYSVTVGSYKRDGFDQLFHGRVVHFGPTISYHWTSAKLKQEVSELFQRDQIDLTDKDFCLGFIAGILSTDCTVSHKKGNHGIKHTIEFGLGRKKWGPEWLIRKQKLVMAILANFGIMAVSRGRKIYITSLVSYNRTADIFQKLVVGKNHPKLFHVDAKTKITSYDSILDDEYIGWLKSIKFNTSATVRLGLHSRIYMGLKKGRVTSSLMETLKEKWTWITDEPYVEPEKRYLLNPVTRIEKGFSSHVYDLTIEGEPNFCVAGGVVHNCIDEMDKMTDQDRSSMHEAMESQSISIAKAGITATLQSRTCVLGAANPKYGRFDENEAIGGQINMPPALLSRFDLIFALLDKPNQERDTKIAEHIIRGHTRGAVLKQGVPNHIDGIDVNEIMSETEALKPYFEQEFIRKYVKYAKRITPVLSKDAQRLILDTYLSIRKLGEGPNASVPITARQLEAFIRLSEASARIRLNSVVEKQDAERAVRIVRYYLEKMAKDSGQMDVDKLMTGTTRTERNKISIVRTLIHENSDPYKGAQEHVLIERAGARNISEQELKDTLKKMKTAGEIYESQSGYVKFVGND